jgi:hypothetical protein
MEGEGIWMPVGKLASLNLKANTISCSVWLIFTIAIQSGFFLPRDSLWKDKAARCAALELVGPHGLEPWTKGL